jgi:Zn finger protein HypA/HybF involved in hydrogenase expression
MILSIKQDRLEDLVKNSLAVTQVLEKLGLRRSGSTLTRLGKYIKELGIDTSHFLGPGLNCGENHKGGNPPVPLDQLLTADSKYSRHCVKGRLIKEKILIEKCALCGQLPEWQGKKLVFVLDHINGTNNDHRLENLRFLCPNCNSQTDTFTGRNVRLKRLNSVL